MTKKILSVIAACVLLFACSRKGNQEVVPEKTDAPKVPFRVSVADFIKKVETLPMPDGRTAGAMGANAKDSSLQKISDIYFFAYKPDGSVASIIHQKSTDNNFGVITDSLQAGRYNIAVLASGSPLDTFYFVNKQDNVTSTGFQSRQSSLTEMIPFSEIFYKKAPMYVDSIYATNVDLTLDRLVGKLEVNIYDAPQIAPDSNVIIRVEGEHEWFFIENESTSPASLSHGLWMERTSRTSFSIFILNTQSELSIDISYPDRAPGTHRSLYKKIKNIKVGRNRKTILSGSIYNSPPFGSTDVGVSVNENWGWPTTEIHF